MKESRSNRTNNILKWINQLSTACCVMIMLGSCALMQSKPTPPPEPPPEPEPEPVLPCSTLPTKDLERQALELLDNGKVVEAREKLDCAVELSPDSRQAKILLEQLDADPIKYLGTRYFWYEVRSSETLSKIAKQYLGSSLKFVILARYNRIKVPANLYTGQKIKIPGRKPVVYVPPEPEVPSESILPDSIQLRDQALEMEQQGKLDKAFVLMTQVLTEDPNLENAQADLMRIRQSLLLQLEEEAYNQELSGNTDQAAEIWRRILAIDPGNIPAQLALKRLTE